MAIKALNITVIGHILKSDYLITNIIQTDK